MMEMQYSSQRSSDVNILKPVISKENNKTFIVLLANTVSREKYGVILFHPLIKYNNFVNTDKTTKLFSFIPRINNP